MPLSIIRRATELSSCLKDMMKHLTCLYGILLAGACASVSLAASPSQPPMDQFNNAYYTCDAGAAFAMSYDSKKPTSVVMTTSNNNKRHSLKRTPVANGVEFSGDAVKFWTDGNKVVVEGTQLPLTNGSTKAG